MKTCVRRRRLGAVAAGFLTGAIVSGVVAASPAAAQCKVGWFQALYNDESNNWAETCEQAIDHYWGMNGPVVELTSAGKADTTARLDSDHFTVTWQGRFNFEARTYVFLADTDDGMKAYVDGRPILDEWRAQGMRHYEVLYPMTAGVHVIKVVYYEDTNAAVARFWWERR